ncbi:hypothetical protein JYT97_03885 [Haliea sp. AH-315-K21]|uniref:Uncharacterized protein n=1 Tax=SAR86 cluster bacterium TaxID=2030880 RepID=A0A2A5CH84_9GAMM|nr:hypothetical protein [Haliea sp. AH-315-K21]PCJ42855.1 MAG: hypothetical protein COA71_04985 [SAR86 cluster bacterium]
MNKYNYKNCQSLFGYSAEVHIRCKGQCQLCGCGGTPIDFDLWRQMTVEHLIGKSQGGYLRQISKLVEASFPLYSETEKTTLSKEIDVINTVTACQFCNSTTSRDINEFSMPQLFESAAGCKEELIKNIVAACKNILHKKRQSVQWKLESVEEAFNEHVATKITSS